VDDIVITGDDNVEISRLKVRLSKEFEVKDLGQLKYFLGIEIARSSKGIVLSQRKYVLDLLNETELLQLLLSKIISCVHNQEIQLIERATSDLSDDSFICVTQDLMYPML
jgi:hypothetical protein